MRREMHRLGRDVHAIREQNRPSWVRPVFNGFLYGAAFVVGSAAAAVLGGWILSVFNIIPGLGELASYIRAVL